MTTTRNDILGLIDYLNEAEAFDDNTVEWHTRCIAWITEKLEQENNQMTTDYDQIMRKSHITFINEIMRQTQTRDSMNDYYPNRLWLDTDTGTYGDTSGLVIIDTTDWTQDDCDTWENMTDSERNSYGKGYQCAWSDQ